MTHNGRLKRDLLLKSVNIFHTSLVSTLHSQQRSFDIKERKKKSWKEIKISRTVIIFITLIKYTVTTVLVIMITITTIIIATILTVIIIIMIINNNNNDINNKNNNSRITFTKIRKKLVYHLSKIGSKVGTLCQQSFFVSCLFAQKFLKMQKNNHWRKKRARKILGIKSLGYWNWINWKGVVDIAATLLVVAAVLEKIISADMEREKSREIEEDRRGVEKGWSVKLVVKQIERGVPQL